MPGLINIHPDKYGRAITTISSNMAFRRSVGSNQSAAKKDIE
jgi:hypothetical protein